jgi:hypothetical protein
MRLVPGKGDEEDTLKDKTIYVYDTDQFPFYPGPPPTPSYPPPTRRPSTQILPWATPLSIRPSPPHLHIVCSPQRRPPPPPPRLGIPLPPSQRLRGVRWSGERAALRVLVRV